MESHLTALGTSFGEWVGYSLLAAYIMLWVWAGMVWAWRALRKSWTDRDGASRGEAARHKPTGDSSGLKPSDSVETLPKEVRSPASPRAPVAELRVWETVDALVHDHQPEMIAISLQSGSNGNCFYVQSNGTGVLVDAGISGHQAQQRLARFGIDIRSVRGVLISHEHRDHVECAGIYHRKFGLPVFMTRRTLIAAKKLVRLGPFRDVQFFHPGEKLEIGDLVIETLPTPHDVVEGVAFVISNGKKRLGVLTDLGHPFEQLGAVLRSLDAVFLESNYDPDMLRRGHYPPDLKARIAGPRGHLSNRESAELLSLVGAGRLRWACLAHLSGENNDPGLALATHRRVVPPSLLIAVASRHEALGLLEV